MLFEPFYSLRPWGGQRLARELGKNVPAEKKPCGEVWELSDHPDGRSSIANGPYAGMEFGELVRRFPRGMCGVDAPPERFPLLVKYLDVGDDLSIQVHPADHNAPPGDRGKTECWYIMDCADGTELILGVSPGVDARRLAEAARTGRMEPCVRRVPIRPGDFIYLPAGTIHAALAGTLICEVQQSSNTTYRLWDWGRKPLRPLHIEQAVAVAQYDPARNPEPVHVPDLPGGGWRRLARNDTFEVRTARWDGGEAEENRSANRHGLILNVVENGGRLVSGGGAAETLLTGQTWYLPAGLDQWRLEAGPDGLRVLLSESLEFAP